MIELIIAVVLVVGILVPIGVGLWMGAIALYFNAREAREEFYDAHPTCRSKKAKANWADDSK